MLEVENLDVYNVENAIYGMRRPLNSHGKMDSKTINGFTHIGMNDLKLMKKLYKAGKDHRKYLRQMLICLDIKAPRSWWIQFDTYKIGTASNSDSTMHCVHKQPFALSDFSITEKDYTDEERTHLYNTIYFLNKFRDDFLETNSKVNWRKMIDMLPQSYNQTRTVTMNYEVAYNIYNARKNHKLSEWHELCEVFENELPYFKEIMED